MNKKMIEPKLGLFEFSPTKTDIGIGDTIQDTSVPAMPRETGLKYCALGSYPKELSPESNSKVELVVVSYRPTMFGSDSKYQVQQALQDFYNKVTGSALQSTSISYADLGAYIWLSKEWRALIKDIDRVLTIYNQTSIIKPVYGKRLVDSIYGSGVYAKVAANADAITRTRNELAKRINVQLPMMKGLRWTATDDMCLDNIYADDPDGKGSLIAFKREGFTVHLDMDGALIGLSCFDMWKELVTYDIDAWVTRVLEHLTDLTESVWFSDVRPYIENLQRKGGFLEDAGISESYLDKIANREFAPYYCPDVIDMLRNASIRTQILNQSNEKRFGTYVHESADGYFEDPINVAADIFNPETFAMDPFIVTNEIKNFEKYPADQNSLRKSIAFDYILARAASNSQELRVRRASGYMITKMEIIIAISDTYDTITLNSNLVALYDLEAGAPFDTNPAMGLNLFNLPEFTVLLSLNCLPKLVVCWLDQSPASSTIKALYNSINQGDIAISPVILDVDNLVKLDLIFYVNYFNILSYEQVYNCDAVMSVAGK